MRVKRLTAQNFSSLPTERITRAAPALDRLTAAEVIRLLNRENFAAAHAAQKASAAVARAVRLCELSFSEGGSIVFIGAGTSGRLGVLEAAECPPTFGVARGRVKAVMAGGSSAVFHSREGAEDDAAAGVRDILKKSAAGDCVIGITASGVTPYVLGALAAARKGGRRTVLVTCNPKADARCADVVAAVNTGAELLGGSTRMKAGSAVKMVLNTITTVTMIRCGHVYRNYMVDVKPSSLKLEARALRIIAEIGGVGADAARVLYARAGGSVKLAVIMARLGTDIKTARRLLRGAQGHLRRVIE